MLVDRDETAYADTLGLATRSVPFHPRRAHQHGGKSRSAGPVSRSPRTLSWPPHGLALPTILLAALPAANPAFFCPGFLP